MNFLDHLASDCVDIKVLVDDQLARVRARLKSMRALEKQLTAIRTQCLEPYATSDCGILHELQLAAHGEACACHAAHRGVALTRRN